MKKLPLLFLLVALSSLGFGSAALAEQDNQGLGAEQTIKVEQGGNGGDSVITSKIKIQGDVNQGDQGDRQSADSQAEQNDQNDQASSTADLTEAESHRSSVANFVQSLLKVADREPGIGEEVRVIAREQKESGSTTVQVMRELEDRGGFKTFLLGTDYKNLGVLRREIATSSRQIERLKALSSETADVQVKADLAAQIDTLESNQIKVDKFIQDQENAFSLFGWLARLLNR